MCVFESKTAKTLSTFSKALTKNVQHRQKNILCSVIPPLSAKSKHHSAAKTNQYFCLFYTCAGKKLLKMQQKKQSTTQKCELCTPSLSKKQNGVFEKVSRETPYYNGKKQKTTIHKKHHQHYCCAMFHVKRYKVPVGDKPAPKNHRFVSFSALLCAALNVDAYSL